MLSEIFQPSLEKSANTLSGLTAQFDESEKNLVAARNEYDIASLALADGRGTDKVVSAAQKSLDSAQRVRDAAHAVLVVARSRHAQIEAKAVQQGQIDALKARGSEIARLSKAVEDAGDYINDHGRQLAERYARMHVDLEDLCFLIGKKRVEDMQQQVLFPLPLGRLFRDFLFKHGASFGKPPMDMSQVRDIGAIVREGVAGLRQRVGATL